MKNMKKLFLLLCAAAALSACSAVERTVDETDYSDPVNSDITMNIAETEITSETTSLTLEYKYVGTADDVLYCFGCDYTLERLENGSWYIVPFSENAVFIELGYLIGSESPNQYTSVSLSPDFYAEKLTSGTYRVVKPIEDMTFTAEFEFVIE